jgi:tetratricopeptide (TPR) repeat protein
MISAQFQQNSSVRFRTLYTDILSESASRAYDLGENTVAQEYVKQAKVACDEDSTLRLRGVDLLLTQVILNLFRMRAGGGVTLGEQVMLVNQARDTALQCGSMNLRLRAETLRILLQEPYEGAIQSVKCILSLANQLHNRRLTTTLTLVLADYLLDSDLWPEAGDLLCYSLPEGSYDWGTMMLLRGIYNLKRGAFQDARRCSERALQVAQRSDALRLQCSTLTALATTAYLSRHEEEAIDYILAAVPIAEQHASALSRLKTYQGAALITGKSKYAKEARNLRVVLQR